MKTPLVEVRSSHRLVLLGVATFLLSIMATAHAQVSLVSGTTNFGSTTNVCPNGQTSPVPCSSSNTLSYSIQNVTIGAVNVVTQGGPPQGSNNLDFTLSSTDCANNAGPSCSVTVTFAPIAPGVRMGAVQILDNNNPPNLLLNTFLQGVAQGPTADFIPISPSCFGCGQNGLGSGWSNPGGLALDSMGDVFVADTNNNQVVEITASNGYSQQTTVITSSTSVAGSTLNSPTGVAIDGAGDLYIADSGNVRVVEVPFINGAYALGSAQTVGAGLVQPTGVAVDGSGDVFIADGGLSQIQEITSGGTQTQIGSGLSGAYSVALDSAQNVYAAGINVVEFYYPYSNPNPYTLPITGLSFAHAVAVDAAGDVFFADTGNNAVRVITAANPQQQISLTNIGYQFPGGVALDGAGDVFISNSGNNGVLEALLSQPQGYGFNNTIIGYTSTDSPWTVSLLNMGNQVLTGNITGLGNGFVQSNAGMTGACNVQSLTAAGSLAIGGTCNLSTSFEPTAAQYYSQPVLFTDNSLNSSNPSAVQTMNLQGLGTLAPQYINFTTNAPATAVNGTNFTVAATAFSLPTNTASGQTVTFSAAPGSVCSSSGPQGQVFTMTSGTGSCTVIASAPMTNYYASASSMEITTATGAAAPLVEDTSAGVNNVTNAGTANVCHDGQPGNCSNTAINVTYTIDSNVTVSSVNVLTQGAPKLDFTEKATTCRGKLKTTKQTCSVTVSFAPLHPGLRIGAIQLVSSGAVLVTTPIQGVGQGPEIALASPIQLTLPQPTNPGSGYNQPQDVALDGLGNVFIADSNNNQVVELIDDGASQQTIGTGLNIPNGVAVDGAGNVYIADSNNNRVVEVPYLGNGLYGTQFQVGGTFNQPYGIAVDGGGNIFVSDTNNNQVVEISGVCCSQTVVATGLNSPLGLAVDAADNVFVANTLTQSVLEFEYQNGTYGTTPVTVANAAMFGLSNTYGVAVDAAEDVFITDTFNYRVVEVSPTGPGTWGNLTNVGNGTRYASGVAVDAEGDVFIGDSGNNRVVEEPRSQPPALSFPPTVEHQSSSPQVITAQNIGNGDLIVSSLSSAADFTVAQGSGYCPNGSPLAPGSTCNISIELSPTSNNSFEKSVLLTDNSLNNVAATQKITLLGSTLGKNVPQTIAFDPVPPKYWPNGSSFVVFATSSSGLAVTFSAAPSSVCSYSAATGMVTMNASSGTCVVTASQSGGTNSGITYEAATSVNKDVIAEQ